MFSCFRCHSGASTELCRNENELNPKQASGVLVCTDVAARGLDIPNIDWVVQVHAIKAHCPVIMTISFARICYDFAVTCSTVSYADKNFIA